MDIDHLLEDPATARFFSLSLHDALPIFPGERSVRLDLVPVDLVANACISAAAHPPDKAPRTIAIASGTRNPRSEEHTSELQSPYDLVCRLLLEKKMYMTLYYDLFPVDAA